MSNANVNLIWTGTELRLVDLLSANDLNTIVNTFSKAGEFSSQHVKVDGSALADAALEQGLIDPEFVRSRINWVKSLEAVGYTIRKGLDGRSLVSRFNDQVPVRGDIPPGAQSAQVIARDFLHGLRNEGQYLPEVSRYQPGKKVIVSEDFAEFLRENGEPVVAIPLSRDGSKVGCLYPAFSESEVTRNLAKYKLALMGSNDPDGGDIARIAQLKTPKQYAAWKAGLADQWRMMESMRSQICYCASSMSNGAFADPKVGRSMREAFSSFQGAFQMIARDAEAGELTQETAQQFMNVSSSLLEIREHFMDKNVAVPDAAILKALDDTLTLGVVIGNDIETKVLEAERSKQPRSIGFDVEAGFS